MLVVFLVLSAMLARFLSTENVERDDVLAALEAETSGNERALFSQLSGCRATPRACRRQVELEPDLRRTGAIKIVSLTSATAYSLTGATGHTRVAWVVLGRLPVVQCVNVKRTGSFLHGHLGSLRPQQTNSKRRELLNAADLRIGRRRCSPASWAASTGGC